MPSCDPVDDLVGPDDIILKILSVGDSIPLNPASLTEVEQEFVAVQKRSNEEVGQKWIFQYLFLFLKIHLYRYINNHRLSNVSFVEWSSKFDYYFFETDLWRYIKEQDYEPFS